MRFCPACGLTKVMTDFSRSQRAKGAAGRCMMCVSLNRPLPSREVLRSRTAAAAASRTRADPDDDDRALLQLLEDALSSGSASSSSDLPAAAPASAAAATGARAGAGAAAADESSDASAVPLPKITWRVVHPSFVALRHKLQGKLVRPPVGARPQARQVPSTRSNTAQDRTRTAAQAISATQGGVWVRTPQGNWVMQPAPGTGVPARTHSLSSDISDDAIASLNQVQTGAAAAAAGSAALVPGVASAASLECDEAAVESSDSWEGLIAPRPVRGRVWQEEARYYYGWNGVELGSYPPPADELGEGAGTGAGAGALVPASRGAGDWVGIQHLPAELLLHVFRFIESPVMLGRCMLVCRTWHIWLSLPAIWEARVQNSLTMHRALRFLNTYPPRTYNPPRRPDEPAKDYVGRIVALVRRTFTDATTQNATNYQLAIDRYQQSLRMHEENRWRTVYEDMTTMIPTWMIWLAALLISIFLPLKLDGTIHWPWFAVFSPVLALSLVVVVAAYISLLAGNYDRGCSEMVWLFFVFLASCAALCPLWMILLKLDGAVDARWAYVLIPTYVVFGALAMWILALYGALAFDAVDSYDMSEKVLKFLAGLYCFAWFACVTVFFTLLTLKIDGELPNASPWHVAVPLFILAGLTVIGSGGQVLYASLSHWSVPASVVLLVAASAVGGTAIVALLIAAVEHRIKSFFYAFIPLYVVGLVSGLALGIVTYEDTRQDWTPYRGHVPNLVEIDMPNLLEDYPPSMQA